MKLARVRYLDRTKCYEGMTCRGLVTEDEIRRSVVDPLYTVKSLASKNFRHVCVDFFGTEHIQPANVNLVGY